MNATSNVHILAKAHMCAYTPTPREEGLHHTYMYTAKLVISVVLLLASVHTPVYNA